MPSQVSAAPRPGAIASRPAFQPFTFAGVARFASARLGRVFGVALLFAGLAGAVIGCIAAQCWAPVLTEAAAALPARGSISNGRLDSSESRLLGANSFLSISLGGTPPGNADLGVQFGQTSLKFTSLYGLLSIPYPREWTIPFNRDALVPLWGAWQKPFIVSAILGTAILLVVAWWMLALIYAVIPFLVGAAAGRDMNFRNAFRLSIAAQWSGSLIVSFSLAAYSTGQLSLIFLCLMFLVHFVPTLVYLLGSPFFLPRKIDSAKVNPFDPEKKRRRGAANPFSA